MGYKLKDIEDRLRWLERRFGKVNEPIFPRFLERDVVMLSWEDFYGLRRRVDALEHAAAPKCLRCGQEVPEEKKDA